MNANELADKLEKPMLDNPDCPNFSRTRGFMEQVVAMLRQQQAEIEALRMGFAGNGTSDSELAEVRAMANRQFLEIQALKQIIDANNLIQNIGQFVRPVKELTDEEMYQLASECGFNVDGKAINDGIETAADFHNELFDFAKAILKKAKK